MLFYRGDGAHVQHPDTLHIPESYSGGVVVHPDIGDLDGDGRPELVQVSLTGQVTVYRNFTPGAMPVMERWLISNLPAEHTR